MEPYFDRLIVLFVLTLSRYNDLQKWIGNQKRKRSVVDEECEDVDIVSQQTLKKAKSIRGPSSYNLFCV